MCHSGPTDAEDEDEIQRMGDGTSTLSALGTRPGQPGTHGPFRLDTFLKGKT